MPERASLIGMSRQRENPPMAEDRIEGVEVWPNRWTTCSMCGTRVQVGAPSEVCCPALRDKPAPPWVYEFHEKHGVWPKWEPR